MSQWLSQRRFLEFFFWTTHSSKIDQWIGLRENLPETKDFPIIHIWGCPENFPQVHIMERAAHPKKRSLAVEFGRWFLTWFDDDWGVTKSNKQPPKKRALRLRDHELAKRSSKKSPKIMISSKSVQGFSFLNQIWISLRFRFLLFKPNLDEFEVRGMDPFSHRIGWWENWNRKALFIFDGKNPWVSC